MLPTTALRWVRQSMENRMEADVASAPTNGVVSQAIQLTMLGVAGWLVFLTLKKGLGPWYNLLGLELPDARDIPLVGSIVRKFLPDDYESIGQVPDILFDDVDLPPEVRAILRQSMPDFATPAEPAAGAPVRTAGSTVRTTLTDVDRVRKVRATPEEAPVIEALKAQGASFAGGHGLTAETRALTIAAANKYKVPADWMLAMVMMESGGNPNAVSSTGAVGLLQFTGGTAKDYGLRNRFDPVANLDAGAHLMKDNMATLEKAGVPVTLASVYLAHQQGAGGAIELYRGAADPTHVIPDKIRTNMGLNYGDKSAKEYVALNERKIGAALQASMKDTTVGYPSATQLPPTTPVRAEGAPAAAVSTSPPKVEARRPAPIVLTRPAPVAATNIQQTGTQGSSAPKMPSQMFMVDDTLVFTK